MAGDKIQNDVHSQPVGRLENMAQVRVVAVQEVHLFQQSFPFDLLHVGHLPVKGIQHAHD